jgi:hypothetical protein
MEIKGSDKIPITVGVVGHLDAVTTPEHKVKIEQLFKDLASAYPNSPVYLFSSIASGADRFAVNIFLDLKKKHDEFKNRFELIVPMPFEYEDYKNDFAGSSDQEFDTLLKQAKRKFSISLKVKNGGKEEHYLETGKFVADSSLILMALWDGKEGKKGGTAEIVNYKRTGDESNAAQSTFEYDGSVFILPCRRSTSAAHTNLDPGMDIEFSLKTILKDTSIKEALEKIEEINSDALRLIKKTYPDVQSLSADNSEGQGDSPTSVLSLFSVLDGLALLFNKRYRHTVIWLFILGLFIVISLATYTNLWLNKAVLALSMLLFIIAGIIYYYSRISRDHSKYLYNRTLAEALRIQYYWNKAGINYNVSDYILRIHRKEFTWIEHILSSIYGITYNDKPVIFTAFNDLSLNWVQNQADFFESSVRKMTHKLAEYHLVSNISLAAASVLLLSIFFLEKYYVVNNYMNFLQVLIAALLSIFALIRAYIEIKGYEQLLKQYELMNDLYQKAGAKINTIFTTMEDAEAQRTFLRELFFIIGKEALIENGTWYLILKEKEPGIEGI